PDRNLPAGTYPLVVQSLQGSTHNYVLADSGHMPGSLTVARAPLTWAITNGTSFYGDEQVYGANVLIDTGSGFASSSLMQFEFSITDGAGTPMAARSPAGTYTQRITAILGDAAANYVLAPDGHRPGRVTRRPAPMYIRMPDVVTTYGQSAWAPATATIEG